MLQEKEMFLTPYELTSEFEERAAVPYILRSRNMANTMKPCNQWNVDHAVLSKGEELEWILTELGPSLGFSIDEMHRTLEGIAYVIARGQHNCSNFMNWAGLVMYGNAPLFNNLSPQQRAAFQLKPPAEIHPEFRRILDTYPGPAVHFTAAVIPSLEMLSGDRLRIDWPNFSYRTVGIPPVEIPIGSEMFAL